MNDSVPPPPPLGAPVQTWAGQAPSIGPAGGDGPSTPTRPQVKTAAVLIVVGSLLAIAGTFLPWVTGGGASRTGFDTYRIRDNLDIIEFDAPGVLVLIVVGGLIGLGIALFLAGRLLAVAIISIVVASIGAIVGLVMVVIMVAVIDDFGGSLGFGVVMTLIGPLVALAGAIAATARRRRWN